jgi:hypothetical protein
MDSDTLRSLVKTAATGMPGARLWANGLGFDSRGTQYSPIVVEIQGRETLLWYATRSQYEDPPKRGQGGSPQAAKRDAKIGRDKHTRSRPL